MPHLYTTEIGVFLGAGNETAERMAFYGILVNLLFYLYFEVHIGFPEASTLVTNVLGTAALTPLLGAFIADAYIGRYWTIGIFSTIYLVVSLCYLAYIEYTIVIDIYSLQNDNLNARLTGKSDT